MPTPNPTSRRATRLARPLALAAAMLLLAAAAASAHDMFLKPTRFFAPVNDEVRVRLLNGTFTRSENSILRSRVADFSLVSPRGRVKQELSEWSETGDTTIFHVHTRASGTYVVGASTKPSVIAQTADDFNLYLETDGIPDVLAARRAAGELGKGVKERYAKHVKTLLQVGEVRTEHFATVMGYPAELVPMENPYTLTKGATLRVRTLLSGKPAGNQLVIFGGTTDAEAPIEPQRVRSDAEGIVRVPLRVAGTWYLKFIHMKRVPNDTVDYESQWATLTFQVR